jgi:AcrR family transcriptional regulator
MTDRQREIGAIAAGLFMAHGYAGTSLAMVARATEMQKPSLYHHFASKEALFVFAMTVDLADNVERLCDVQHDSTMSHDEKIHAMMRIVYESCILSPAGRMAPVVAETARQIPAVAQGFYDGFIEKMTDRVIAIVADGAADGHFKPIDDDTLYHIVFGPPVSLAISQSMFQGIPEAQARLDVDSACAGLSNALLALLKA